MIGDLHIEKVEEPGRTRFSLEGKIDESSDYSAIVTSDASHIVLDFEKVTLINSSGIQRWIQFLRGLPANWQIEFDNCPLRIINQMNLIPAFVAGRTIIPLSFYAPYYCEGCDESRNVKIITKDEFDDLSRVKVPERSCSECGATMEFDGIEKKYFMFLKRSA